MRKAYYSARHEAAVQIDEIVGETASEADSSDSLERDHGHHGHHGGGSHDKDDDVIRCICGMYRDEGLMIQCEKCMVSAVKCISCFTSLKRYIFLLYKWLLSLKTIKEVFRKRCLFNLFRQNNADKDIEQNYWSCETRRLLENATFISFGDKIFCSSNSIYTCLETDVLVSAGVAAL